MIHHSQHNPDSNPQRSAEQNSFPDFFNDPSGYRVVAGGVQHYEARSLLARHRLNGDECVIDIGSGDGSFTCGELLGGSGAVIGVDVSQAMVDSLNATSREKMLSSNKTVMAIRGDAGEFGGEWVIKTLEAARELGGADVIFSNATLHHIYSREGLINAISNFRAILDNSHRSREYPAVMLLSFAGRGNYEELIQAAETARRELKLDRYFESWTGYPLLRPGVEEFKEIVSAAGIDSKNVDAELVEICTPFSNVEELQRFCKLCLRSYMNQVRTTALKYGEPVGDVDRLLDRFAGRISELYLEQVQCLADGSIPLVSTNIEVKITMPAKTGEVSVESSDFSPVVPVSSFRGGTGFDVATEQKLIEFLDTVSQMSQVLAYKPRIDEIMDIKPGMAVLDAGAGVGSDTFRFSALVGESGRVVALDRNQYRLSVLQERAREQGITNVEVLPGDIQNLISLKGQFDRVFAERTLIHCADPEQALKELFQALKPGGRIVVVEPDFTGLNFESDDPELTARIVALRAGEISNPAIGRQLVSIATELRLPVVAHEVRLLSHNYSSSQLLDLDDLAILADRNEASCPVSPEAIRTWLDEQATRESRGEFKATTPMHIFAVTRPEV